MHTIASRMANLQQQRKSLRPQKRMSSDKWVVIYWWPSPFIWSFLQIPYNAPTYINKAGVIVWKPIFMNLLKPNDLSLCKSIATNWIGHAQRAQGTMREGHYRGLSNHCRTCTLIGQMLSRYQGNLDTQQRFATTRSPFMLFRHNAVGEGKLDRLIVSRSSTSSLQDSAVPCPRSCHRHWSVVRRILAYRMVRQPSVRYHQGHHQLRWATVSICPSTL